MNSTLSRRQRRSLSGWDSVIVGIETVDAVRMPVRELFLKRVTDGEDCTREVKGDTGERVIVVDEKLVAFLADDPDRHLGLAIARDELHANLDRHPLGESAPRDDLRLSNALTEPLARRHHGLELIADQLPRQRRLETGNDILGPMKVRKGIDRKSTRLNSSHVRISY